MLTTFPSLLTCLSFLAGRSIGSSKSTPSCPVVSAATRRGRRIWCCSSLTAFALMLLPAQHLWSFSNSTCNARPASRCSRSSDSVPAGSAAAAAEGLFAASAFFAWARVLGAGLESALAGAGLASARVALAVEGAGAGAFNAAALLQMPCNYRETTFPRLRTTKSPLRLRRYHHNRVKLQ